ncbi:MAG: LysR family transcriptional regulator [Bacillota bacterium]|jgi:DNA-binding transcriptional LysR family regulator|nr:LysR family transcriptional regulator [Bacillota bacterium]NLL26520.1 LysR family transcriptional regulator [Erysipelotrichia bacterium]
MLDSKLETLLVLHEEGNFTKASNRLGITQPAVSTHIKQLEEYFNCKLFIRSKNEIKPTEQGLIVINYSKRMKALERKLLDELSAGDNKPTKIKIGITHTSENNLIAETIGKYSSMNNAISITVITDVIKNLYSMLENYELDLIIVEEKLNKPNLRFLMMDTDYLLCILSNNNKLAKKSLVTINDLKKQKMIMRLPTSATRELFDSTLKSINESIDNFNIVLEVDNISTIKDLVRKDIGVSILPKSSCENDVRKNRLTALPIENLSMIRETNIVYNNDFIHIHVLDDILKLYKESSH